MSEWISVEDGLPELYEAVLCTNSRVFGVGDKYRRPYWQARRTEIGGTLEDGTPKWVWQAFVTDVIELGATHWMPLPEPPQEKRDGS